MKKFLVSTAECRAYDQDDNLLFTGTTLLDTSIDTSLSNTDVRGGRGNQLQQLIKNVRKYIWSQMICSGVKIAIGIRGSKI